MYPYLRKESAKLSTVQSSTLPAETFVEMLIPPLENAVTVMGGTLKLNIVFFRSSRSATFAVMTRVFSFYSFIESFKTIM
jgi:hypothetical protein